MLDQDGLLGAIWESPHDDAPRLVYADWLEERGSVERADFIRVQCELAEMEPDDPRQEALSEREARLWKKHAKTWKAGLPKLLQSAPFQRGFPFPRRRAVTGNQFLQLTAADLAPAPVWDFRIMQAQKSIAAVLASESMSRVGFLEIEPQQMRDGAADMLAGARFSNVATLGLDAQWIGQGGATALAANPSVRSLRDLSLYSGDLDDAAIATLASAAWFGSLRSLSLGNNPFDSAGLMSLVKAMESGSMRDLSLRGLTVGGREQRFDDKSLAALFGASHLRKLRELDLGINYNGDRLITHLCSKQTAFRLRYLNLDNNLISDAGIKRLASWPGLEKVETLILSSNEIGAAGARALAESPHLARLRTLSLEFTPLASGSPASRTPLIKRFGNGVWFD